MLGKTYTTEHYRASLRRRKEAQLIRQVIPCRAIRCGLPRLHPALIFALQVIANEAGVSFGEEAQEVSMRIVATDDGNKENRG